MNRKHIKLTLITSLVLGFGSCTSEDFWDTFDRTVDGPIDFTVDIESSPAQVAKTRGDNMQANTKVLLKVEGVWKRTATTSNPDGVVSKTTTCTTSGAALNYETGQALYWDDFGIGDPENVDGNNVHNKENGLKVYGVAVDGMATAPTVGETEWKSLPWSTVDSEGKTEVESSKLKKDIIVSNNLSAYKFDDRNTSEKKVMEFRHPLSKITFNIKAGVGFPQSGNNLVGATTYKFEKDPTLTFNNAIANGTINIVSGTADAGTTPATSDIIAGTTSTTDADVTVIKQAIVYPKTSLGKDDDAVIAVLNADDNNYSIRAKEIHSAIDAIEAHKNSYQTMAGYNYIINVTANKTGIIVMATVAKWTDVNSDEVFPKINVTSEVGANNFDKPTNDFKFGFWRSESIDKKYVKAATPTAKTTGSIDWTGTNALYWANHNQHLFLRGIYPEETTVDRQDENSNQYVSVTNGDYVANSFPSNFMIGMPEIAEGTSCGHTGKDMSKDGICAREAAINLNFRYMMSQVEVNLKSESTDNNSIVDLTNATVELVNVYNTGNILLKDRSAEVTGATGDHTLKEIDAATHYYLSVIVPQGLSSIKFKITVYDTAKNTTSVYYADVAPIKVKEKNSTDAAKATDAWKSGVHYVYNLNLTKTEIKATATLTDWTTVEAAEDVWF